MGQKIHPKGFRIGITEDWDAKWFDFKNYAKYVNEDIRIREYLKGKLANAAIAKIEFERFPPKKIQINLVTARASIVIGKKGANVEALKKELRRLTDKDIDIKIRDVQKPELEAVLVAESLSRALERRIAFRRAMKHAVRNTLENGALGIRINLSGRLGGSEIARVEWYREGRVPLHTLRAQIDYALVESNTTYGVIGVKVWIFRKELYEGSLARTRSAQY